MKTYVWRTIPSMFLTGLVLSLFAVNLFAQNMFRKVTDFDGDGRTDFAVTRIENGLKIWYVWQSTAGFRVIHWGKNFDTDAASDYDGDGKTDFAVYRGPGSFPPLFTFYILESQTNNFTYTVFTDFGNFGNQPMHQDYNGDGRTDPAVWLGEFGLTTHVHIRFSGVSNSGFITNIPPSNVPIRIGDTSGDGIADKAYYAFSNNVVTVIDSSTNSTQTFQFGIFNDQYLASDFDGDGKGDLTIWRRSEGHWYWLKSSDNTAQNAHWGMNGDFAVPGDYDGDGKTDLAVWRPGAPQSYYWVNGSSNGINIFPWGLAGDSPVAY
jgi:spore coat protein A, manganese oxidase